MTPNPQTPIEIQAVLANIEAWPFSVQTSRIPELVAIIRQLLGEREWRAMETAPRDGTWVLLLVQNNDLCFQYVGYFVDDCWEEAFSNGTIENVIKWLPLPALPQQQEGG